MRLSVIAGAALVFAFWALPARALDVFDVSGVRVDVTAENAAVARTQALAEGQRKAFEAMLRRLTVRGDWNRLPHASAQTLESVIRDFSVIEEKTSPVRYIASLAYRFKPGEIRALLINFGLPFAETPSKPVLVLPVFQDGSSFTLWEEPNPWKAAWERRPQSTGLVPTVLPLGDLQDIAAISADQALAGDAARLQALATRYGTGDSLVVLGSLTAAVPRELQVAISRHGGTTVQPTKVQAFSPAPNESLDDLMVRVANDLMQQIEDDWKRDNVVRLGAASILPAIVPLQNLADWLAVKERLSRVAIVGGLEGIALSRSEARVNLRYSGTPEQLVTALAQVDLRLSRDGDAWLLVPLKAFGANR